MPATLEPHRHLLIRLGLATAAAALLSLLIGPTGFGWPARGAAGLIFYEVRLPRVILGALVGAGLGMAGAALQGYLRNALAEPGIIGVSGGAAFGAVVAIHTGLAGVAALTLPLAGFIGAGAAAAAVLWLTRDRSDPVTLLLAGVAVSAFAAAATSLALNLSANPFAAAEAIFWMMGSLADRSLTQVALAGPLIGLGMGMLWRLGPALDALSLGEDVARTLGRDATKDRWQLIGGVALTVGAATAVTGAIGFIGLVVPHLLRPLVGERPSALLAASALSGALLLLAADCAIRLLAPLVDVRIGVLTALLGAPFFLRLVARHRFEGGS